MAYFIFLKSLRSLEEFRKNPYVKIPPKSPSTNLQSLGKFKNPIFNSEIPFFLIFGPASSLKLHGAARHIVSAETSLELIPCDGVDVHMGIAIRLPPVSCCAIELVRSKKDLLAISALGDYEFLFNPLEPVFCIHGFLGL
jgi:hypothetical protein